MAGTIRNHNKEQQKNQIRLLQIKKLKEVNSNMKSDNMTLVHENRILVQQCSNLKTLMINYEKESMLHRLESNVSPSIITASTTTSCQLQHKYWDLKRSCACV